MRSETLKHLVDARQIADYARLHGAALAPRSRGSAPDHLGAVLADVVLQAGLNYQTVVKSRVERIIRLFPSASTIKGVQSVVRSGRVDDFLQWKHHVKIRRFTELSAFLERQGVETTIDVQTYLAGAGSRNSMMQVDGVGPKTFDYFCALMGIDRIAVDRHVKTFVSEAGVETTGYDDTQKVASIAADLLGVRRRDFDAWMWRHVSSRRWRSEQYSLQLVLS